MLNECDIMANMKIIYAPFWLGGPVNDNLLKQTKINNLNYDYFIEPFIKPTKELDGIKNSKDVLKYNKKMFELMDSILKNKYFPLVIGGDHSISLGSISAISKKHPNLGIIYIDAHADLNTPKTSPSGNAHGMTLAALLGEGDINYVNFGYQGGKVKKSDLILFGTRDLDLGEVEYVKKNNIYMITHETILKEGLVESVNKAIMYLKSKVDYIHISFDMDSMNPFFFPAVNVPVEGGFNENEIIYIINRIFDNFKVCSMDIVEFNPNLDSNDKTMSLFVKIIEIVRNRTNNI